MNRYHYFSKWKAVNSPWELFTFVSVCSLFRSESAFQLNSDRAFKSRSNLLFLTWFALSSFTYTPCNFCFYAKLWRGQYGLQKQLQLTPTLRYWNLWVPLYGRGGRAALFRWLILVWQDFDAAENTTAGQQWGKSTKRPNGWIQTVFLKICRRQVFSTDHFYHGFHLLPHHMEAQSSGREKISDDFQASQVSVQICLYFKWPSLTSLTAPLPSNY